MAPEILLWKGWDFSPWDLIAADMWSFGMTIFHIMFERLPFEATTKKEIVDWLK